MNFLTAAKAEAVASLIQSLTGEPPIISDMGSYQKISFSPSQQVKIRDYIERQISAKRQPTDILIDVNPVLVPLAVKKLAPFLVASLALGFLLGRKL
jgi:hypothetical protein